MELARNEGQPIQAQLGLWDAVSIIVGIVIGAGIFQSPPLIFGNVGEFYGIPAPTMGLVIWAICGLLAFLGALCYAELATTYPRSGGDYVYLSRAFGPWFGFFFGWAQLVAVLTGSLAAMAYVFADYAIRLFELNRPAAELPAAANFVADLSKSITGKEHNWAVLLAALAITFLSIVNLLGIVLGKRTQNLLTLTKVLGLCGVVAAGFIWGQPSELTASKPATGSALFGLAMIFVLYTYGGWNDAAFVAAEVRNRRRNIPLSLLLGTAVIAVIYMAVNAAYLMALGFDGAKQSRAVAADTLQLAFKQYELGDYAVKAMCVLVMISALGAVNGLILTGSRVYSTLGADYSLLAWLGKWNVRLGSPFWSLVAQGVICLAWIGAVGTETGRTAINDGLKELKIDAIPWDKYFGGFDTLVASTAPVFWFFFLMTGLALFALRQRDEGIQRPFSVPLYPIVPTIFCGTCIYMLYSSIAYAGKLILMPLALMVVGLPFYLFSGRKPASTAPMSQELCDPL